MRSTTPEIVVWLTVARPVNHEQQFSRKSMTTFSAWDMSNYPHCKYYNIITIVEKIKTLILEWHSIKTHSVCFNHVFITGTQQAKRASMVLVIPKATESHPCRPLPCIKQHHMNVVHESAVLWEYVRPAHVNWYWHRMPVVCDDTHTWCYAHTPWYVMLRTLPPPHMQKLRCVHRTHIKMNTPAHTEYIHTHIHTHIHTNTHSRIHAFTHALPRIHTFTHSRMHFHA